MSPRDNSGDPRSARAGNLRSAGRGAAAAPRPTTARRRSRSRARSLPPGRSPSGSRFQASTSTSSWGRIPARCTSRSMSANVSSWVARSPRPSSRRCVPASVVPTRQGTSSSTSTGKLSPEKPMSSGRQAREDCATGGAAGSRGLGPPGSCGKRRSRSSMPKARYIAALGARNAKIARYRNPSFFVPAKALASGRGFEQN